MLPLEFLSRRHPDHSISCLVRISPCFVAAPIAQFPLTVAGFISAASATKPNTPKLAQTCDSW